jgi:hypothetical protein
MLHDRRSLAFQGGVNWGKDRRDGYIHNAARFDIVCGASHRLRLEGNNGPSVDLMATRQHVRGLPH